MAGVKFDITGNANGFVGAARQAENAVKNMSKSVTNEGKALDDMFKKLAGGVSTMAAGLSATALTKKIFDIRSEFQQLEVAFSTMLKSEEKANKLMKDATEFAATTPFDLKGVAAGIKQNLAYGASVDTVIDEMRMLGDVAAGVGAPLNDLVYLYGTLRTSGRVATIDIRQFAGRGIPIYEELAKVLGVAKNEVAGLVTAGKVGFADIEKAFKNMTSAGGMFNNLMANQSKTLRGQYSNLVDNIEMMFNNIGQSTQSVMGDAIGFAGKLVENYEAVGRALAVLATTYGTYKAAVIATAAVEKVQNIQEKIKTFQELSKTMKMATAAQKAFNGAVLANPYVIAAMALTTLIAGVVAFTKHKKAEVEAQKEASREVAKEVNEVNTLAAKLKDSNTAEDERVKVLERLKEIAPDVVDGIDAEATSLENLNLKLEEYNTLKNLEIALKASTQYIDFSESIQSLNDAKAEMEQKKGEITSVWTDLSSKIKQAIESGDVSKELTDYFESFMYDPNVDFAEKIQKVRNAEVQSGINFSNKDDKFLREIFFDTRKDIVDYSTALNNLTVLETNYTNAVEDLRKRIHDSVALVYTDAEEAKKAEETLLVALGLEQAKTTGGGSGADEQAQTEKQKENAYKRRQAEIKAAESLARMKRDLNAKVAKADIDSMEEGYAKTLRTLQFNLEQELQAIEDQKNELLKSKRDEALKSWLAEDPEGRKEYQFVYTAELSPEEEKVFAQMRAQAQGAFNKGRSDAMKQYSGDAEFTKRQFAIDAMSEGAAKDIAQRQLDNEKELHNLEMQREAYIEAAKAVHLLAEQKKAAADPKYLIKEFDASAANNAFDNIVANTKAKQTTEDQDREKESWDEYILVYGNYEAKKEAIRSKYERLRKKAASLGEKMTLYKQEQQELFDLEVAYKKTANSIASLFGDMRKKSAEDLNAIADEGEKALEFIKSGTYSSDNAFGISQAQFDLIKNSPEELDRIAAAILGIREQADDLEGPVTKISEGFKELFESSQGTQAFEKALSKIADGVNEISNAFSFVSDSLSSMGEALGNEGLKKAADGISAALNVASATMSGAQAGAAFGPWGAALGAAVGLASSLVTEISKAKDAVHQAEIDRLAEEVENIEADYDKLGKSIEKAYSVDASDLINQQNTLLEQKKKNLQLMIAEEESKKNSDPEQIKQWKQQIDGIETSIESNAEKAQEAITGISFDSFRDNYLSSLMDMESGTEEFAKNLEDTIRKAMYDALIAEKYQSQLEALYDDLAKAVESGDASQIARVKAQINDLYDKMDAEARLIDERIGYESSSTRSASEKGIAQASQSSVDELNGRMTAIQSHTFSINQNLASVVNISSQILARVSSIDGNAARLATIESDLAYMRSDISDILTKGIRVKA